MSESQIIAEIKTHAALANHHAAKVQEFTTMLAGGKVKVDVKKEEIKAKAINCFTKNK